MEWAVVVGREGGSAEVALGLPHDVKPHCPLQRRLRCLSRPPTRRGKVRRVPAVEHGASAKHVDHEALEEHGLRSRRHRARCVHEGAGMAPGRRTVGRGTANGSARTFRNRGYVSALIRCDSMRTTGSNRPAGSRTAPPLQATSSSIALRASAMALLMGSARSSTPLTAWGPSGERNPSQTPSAVRRSARGSAAPLACSNCQALTTSQHCDGRRAASDGRKAMDDGRRAIRRCGTSQ